MIEFPYFNFPYNSYRYHNDNNFHSQSKKDYEQNNSKSLNQNYEKKEENKKNTSSYYSNMNNSSSSITSKNKVIFSFLGINLYLDDIIILAIIYFLYSENIKDDMLYIILFLLLLS